MDPPYFTPVIGSEFGGTESAMEVSDESSESSSSLSDGDSVWSYVSEDDSEGVSPSDEFASLEGIAMSTPEPGSQMQVHPYMEIEPQEENVSVPSSHIEGLDDEEGVLCNICLSAWANFGPHRICALKCGHLFGFKCLERWLSNKKNCPTCKTRVRAKDIWFIHANKLVASDPSELAEVRKKLQQAVEERDKTAAELEVSRAKANELMDEMADLGKQLQQQTKDSRASSSRMSHSMSQNAPVRLYMDKSLDICKHSGCRVLAINGSLDLLVASMKSPNNVYTGYGLKKISILSYKQLSFLPLHRQPIRDVCFHPENMWTLTVGMDKTAKLVDLTSNNVLGSATCQTPLWSCCWDIDNGYYFYCGAQSGTVFKYDLRNLDVPVASLSVPGDMSPVVSVAKIPNRPGQHSVSAGIISCKLNSMWFFQSNNEDYTRHNLPLDGPFVSMKYQRHTDQLLVSARPNNQCLHSKHIVCTLGKEGAQIKCNVVHSFAGGGMQKFLSKSTFISNNGSDYVAAFRESDQCVHLWSVNSGEKVAAAPVRDVVLDISGVENSSGNYLVSLTGKKLDVFKFIRS